MVFALGSGSDSAKTRCRSRVSGGGPATAPLDDESGRPRRFLRTLSSVSTRRTWLLALLTILTMLPVTGVVPVLKPLVADHYGLGAFATSLFMSLNMLGALLAAPLVGWLSDRFGWTRRLLVGASALDGLLFLLLAELPPFPVLIALRVAEGMAHITALSMLLALVSRHSDQAGRRSRMAGMGGAIVLGVAIGAPLGGLLGREDPTLPLVVGGWIGLLLALVAWPAASGLDHRPNPDAVPRRPSLLVAPGLRLPYLFSFVDRFTVGFFVVAFPLLAGQELGLGPGQVGLLIGAFMLPFALLNYPAGRLAERHGPWVAILGGSLVYAGLFSAIPWSSATALPWVMAGCGLMSAAMFGPVLVLVLTRSPPETRAAAVGGFNAAGSIGFLIGPLLAGLLIEGLRSTGTADPAVFRWTFAAGAASQLVAVAVALLSDRSARNVPSTA